jgi:hypothetical protein
VPPWPLPRRRPCAAPVGHVAAALLGLPDVGLVGLQQPRHLPGLVAHDLLQEAVPHPEGRAHGNPHLRGRCPNGKALGQAFAMLEKAFFTPQPGQRRVRGRVEGPGTGGAQVSLKAPAVAVLGELEAAAMRASEPLAGSVQGAKPLGSLVLRLNRLTQLIELLGGQTGQPTHQALELVDTHFVFRSETRGISLPD